MQGRQLRNGECRRVRIKASAGIGINEHRRRMQYEWKQAGHRVRRAALAWMGAKMLRGATDIRCQALISLENDIHADPDTGCSADALTGLDVLVVEKAGIGRYRTDKLKTTVREAEAHLVMVHDPYQNAAVNGV